MLNTNVLWFFLLPLVLSIGGYFAFSSKLGAKETLIGSFASFIVSIVVITAIFAAGAGFKTMDTEIWNGEVTSKTREHDRYTEYYDCNCKQVKSCSRDSKGNTSCSTSQVCDRCSRDHYTVEWMVHTTVSDHQIDKKDWTSPTVYSLPNPPRYDVVKNGDPASTTHMYTNYVKAVPETLFKPLDEMGKKRWESMLPEYPQIYDFYKVNRVIPVGINIPDIQAWNDKLSNLLKVTGPTKQANIIVVPVKTADPTYFYALQDKWVNAKKNDVVVVIGATDFSKKIDWVNTMAYTENSILGIKIRDDLLDLTEINKDTVLDTINKNVIQYHVRKPMAKFKYLENEINPPEWLLFVLVCVIIALYVGGYVYLRKHKISYYGYSRRFR